MPLKGIPVFLWITLLITPLRHGETLENKGIRCIAFKIGSFQNLYETTTYSNSAQRIADKNNPASFAQCNKKFVHK